MEDDQNPNTLDFAPLLPHGLPASLFLLRATLAALQGNILSLGEHLGIWKKLYLLGECGARKKATQSISRETLAASDISEKGGLAMLTNRRRADRIQSATVGQAPIGHGRTQGTLM